MSFYDVSANHEFDLQGDVLQHLLEHARKENLDVLLVGAAARDVLIRHVTKAVPERATSDIDVAVAVADWEEYRRLTSALESVGRSIHTFRVRGIDVDIVPFGSIESPDRTITWPDEHRMTTNGFREALRHAVMVTFPGEITVKVASLAAQVVLKLHAWSDRNLTTTRDAIDLRTILLAYSDGPYLDELYVDWTHVLERYDFDVTPAGAHRLGVEIRQTFGLKIAQDCQRIISGDADSGDRLVVCMHRRIEHNRLLLDAILTGLDG